MTHEELRAWCYGEMRALAGSPMHARGEAFLKLLDASLAPPWLADAAEALGEVRPDDGAPLALHWTQVITAIHELREDRDHWKKRGEAAEFSLSMCTDCPSLVWRDGRYWCGEVLREPAVGPRLDVGAGCCAPLFNDLRRAILASMTLDSESSSEAAKRVGGV